MLGHTWRTVVSAWSRAGSRAGSASGCKLDIVFAWTVGGALEDFLECRDCKKQFSILFSALMSLIPSYDIYAFVRYMAGQSLTWSKGLDSGDEERVLLL